MIALQLVVASLLAAASPAALAASMATAAPAAPVAAASPAAPEVGLTLGPENPEVGLVMTLTLTVTGAEGADCTLLDPPRLDGARLGAPMGPSRQSYTEVVNGRTRQSVSTFWQFELVPEREGLISLPPFQLSCRGATVETQPSAFRVAGSRLPEGIVRLELRPSTQELWVGEVVDVDVELSIVEIYHDKLARSGLELVLPWLEDQRGLHMLEPPVPACSRGVMTVLPSEKQIPTCTDRQRIDGRVRILYTQTIPLLATEAGDFTLPASRFSARVVVENGAGGQNPFGFFQGLRGVPSRTVVTDATAPGLAFHVREPPVAGRPVDYTNAVGRYRFEAQADPRRLAVGESCTLQLSLAPEAGRAGQLSLIEWPAFEAALGQFRVFGKDDRTSSRGRVLELEISPINERVTQIPTLSFSFFDPLAERYETRTVGPIPLEVSAGGADGLTVLESQQEILNDLVSIRTELPPPAGAPLPVWLAPALAFLALLVVEARGRVRRWRLANPAEVARRGARAALEHELRGAEGVRGVAAAFARFLSARLEGPPSGMTADEAAPLIADAELARELRRSVSGWEAAYLGGASLELDAARAQARELARKLEQVS